MFTNTVADVEALPNAFPYVFSEARDEEEESN